MAIPDELTRRVNQKGPEIPTARSVIVAYRFGRSTVRANASSAPLSSSPPQAYRGRMSWLNKNLTTRTWLS